MCRKKPKIGLGLERVPSITIAILVLVTGGYAASFQLVSGCKDSLTRKSYNFVVRKPIIQGCLLCGIQYSNAEKMCNFRTFQFIKESTGRILNRTNFRTF